MAEKGIALKWFFLLVFGANLLNAGSLPLRLEPAWAVSSEGKQILKYKMGNDAGQFTFLPIRDWTIGTNALQAKITFSAPDYSGVISFEIVSTNLSLADSNSLDVLQHFECYAGELAGEAVDYQKQVNPRTKLVGRSALFKTNNIAFSLEMTCKPEAFEETSRQFFSFASSLDLHASTEAE